MKYLITLFLLLLTSPSLGGKNIKLSAKEIKTERSIFYAPQAYYEDGILFLCSVSTLHNVKVTVVNSNTNEIVFQGYVTITNGTQINIPLNLPVGYYQLNLEIGNQSYCGEFDIDIQDIQ